MPAPAVSKQCMQRPEGAAVCEHESGEREPTQSVPHLSSAIQREASHSASRASARCEECVPTDVHDVTANACQSSECNRVPFVPPVSRMSDEADVPVGGSTQNECSSKGTPEYTEPNSLESLIALLSSPIPEGGQRIIHLFSGLANRPGSLGWTTRALGYECIEIDTVNGDFHDVLNTRLANAVIAAIVEGRATAVFAGTPCNTFSVARMHDDDGPEQLRSRQEPHGVTGISFAGQRAVMMSDLLVDFTCRAIVAARASAALWVVENPPSRGTGSTRFQARFRDHVSLFQMKAVRTLIEMGGTGSVQFDQCAWGGAYQKFTELLFDERLNESLGQWRVFTCTHCYQGHEAVAIGEMSKASAAYPEAMSWAIAQALLKPSEVSRGQGIYSAPLFRSGSAKPHGPEAVAQAAFEQARAAGSASIRRLEPEEESVLISEPLPEVNVPVKSKWEEAPLRVRDAPSPRTTNELIPTRMQQRLHAHRIATSACYEAASRGRWRWARDHRPQPLVANEDECLRDDVPRGWSWHKVPGQDIWTALTPSAWPESPPDFELNAAAILSYAIEEQFDDMQVIAWMCHGYPGPDMPHHTVIGAPHVGALRDFEALQKCALKDRKRKWGSYGHALPPVWPCLCDPVNIVWRHGKPRMTIDKTMQLTALFEAYNAHIRLDLEPSIDYVSAALAGRGTAILLTAGVEVKLWGFDIDAYFRKSGKQRAHWWMSGLLYWDGYGHDPRIQFGQREAPVRTGRQSTFLRFAMFRELRRIDEVYPSRLGAIQEWIAVRLQAAFKANDGARAYEVYAVLFYVMLFVDDAAGASINDKLYDAQGRPITVLDELGRVVHQTRAQMHYAAAIGVLFAFGHDESAGKGVPPAFVRVFLGVTEDVTARLLYLTTEKKIAYAADCRKAAGGSQSKRGGIIVPYNDLNSLVHKLLHAATLIVLGRQHLYHLKQSLRARNALRCGGCILHEPATTELAWWTARLEQPNEEGVPLAYRGAFPTSGDPAVLDSYSDASRELKSASSSGGGAWCIIDGDFCFVERRWTDHERRTYSINVLEYAIMNIGTFTFVTEARARGIPVTHVREHIDNSAAEMVAERGRPHTREMHMLTERRYERLVKDKLFSAVFRIASIDNDIADGLSRGGEKLQTAIRMAVQAGLRVRRLVPDTDENDLSRILREQ